MVEINYLRNNTESALKRLTKRGKDYSALVQAALQADEQRRSSQTALDQLLAEQKKYASEIGQRMQAGDQAGAEKLKAQVATLKLQSSELKEKLSASDAALREALYKIPNTPTEEVPAGHGAEENEELFRSDTSIALPANAVPHWELAQQYGIIDFELGVKITGAGFPVYRKAGARLQRALIQYFLDRAAAAGYEEVMPPLVVNEASGIGTGQLPDKEGQMYHISVDDLYLIPTAEVPLTNIYRDVLLTEAELPLKITGYTPCFRREAGSYGKDVRGLNRLHQFDKVEIVQLTLPDHSNAALEEMKNHVAHLLESLKLPYRILRLCGGDMGFASAITYDFEVYAAAQKRWLEVSSVSNFETFQSNRLKCRYRDAKGKTQLVHTLNGSALALPRVLAALLENNQSETGINLPEILHPYMGIQIIEK